MLSIRTFSPFFEAKNMTEKIKEWKKNFSVACK
jgi:hypothetical protein